MNRQKLGSKSCFRYWIVIAINFYFNNSQAQATLEIPLSSAATSIIDPTIIYDPQYFAIAYPNGDLPANRGVCTDVIIRAYRKLGIDLQQLVHEDMQANFNVYPKNWDMQRTDKNIDHRRVPNLMTFFRRKGLEKPITHNVADYAPGDIVCWDLGRGIKHIGIVINEKSTDNKRYLIVHNIGQGQVAEDILFHFPIIGHYKY